MRLKNLRFGLTKLLDLQKLRTRFLFIWKKVTAAAAADCRDGEEENDNCLIRPHALGAFVC